MSPYIRYYSPNVNLKTLASLLSCSNAEKQLVSYFQTLTGKKYILLTNSCRSALFLTYSASGMNGSVVTTPLTCQTAVQPIIEAGKTVIFSDIDKNTLNLDATKIEAYLSTGVKFVQLVHHGGVPCEIDDFILLKEKFDFLLIEDCAQALGSKYAGKNVGVLGDVSCFSLIKNSYGIGGGVLATNDEKLYMHARLMQESFSKPNLFLVMMRFIRAFLESYGAFYKLSNLLVKLLKVAQFSIKDSSTDPSFPLIRPDKFSISIAAAQLKFLPELHKRRMHLGTRLAQMIENTPGFRTPLNKKGVNAFGKFFVVGDSIHSESFIRKLNNEGIEAKHLANKTGEFYQHRMTDIVCHSSQELNLPNYYKVHDSIFSLPLNEQMTESDLEIILETMKRILENESQDYLVRS